jgi:hypothetical protein
MSRDLLWIGFLVVVYAVLKYKPDWVNKIIVAVAGKAIGKIAMSQQPDTLTLEPLSGPSTKPEAKSAVESFQRRGFQSAGSFAIAEMKQMPVHFLAKPDEHAIAVVYEHPQAGVWCDIVCRYQNGGSFTISNARMGGGLERQPGHEMVRAPGLTPAALHLRFQRERRAGAFLDVAPAEIPQVFVHAYEQETSWRKAKGLSQAEVKAAAFEKSA